MRIPEGSAPDIKNKSFKIGAEVEIPAGGAEGVLATQGGRFNGWGLYLLAGQAGLPLQPRRAFTAPRVAGQDKLAPASTPSSSTSSTTAAGLGKGGTVTFMVDGKQVAQGKIERTMPFRVSADETLDIGEDTGTPVSEDYQVPFKFTGDTEEGRHSADGCHAQRRRRSGNPEDQGRNRTERITRDQGTIGVARLV